MAPSFEHRVARVVVEKLRKLELTSEVKSVDQSKDPLTDPHSQVGSSADSPLTTQIKTVEDYGDS